MITIKNAQSQLKTTHHKKERIATRHGLGVTENNEITRFLELRLYMSRAGNASVVYCDLWAHELILRDKNQVFYASANGIAGGYGYCKQSTASCEALSFIFEGFDDVSGRGMLCVDEVIKQIGIDVFGLNNVIVIG
jgi:hypothetical protein